MDSFISEFRHMHRCTLESHLKINNRMANSNNPDNEPSRTLFAHVFVLICRDGRVNQSHFSLLELS